MNDHNKAQQFRYLEEVCIPLHRAGFETQPLDESQLPVHWNGAPLCRITGKGSVFYRREDVDTPLAEDALFRVEDIAARTMEYGLTPEEAAVQFFEYCADPKTQDHAIKLLKRWKEEQEVQERNSTNAK